MYAFMSNGYRAILNSQQQLDILCKLYFYPRYVKVDSKKEAEEWFAQNDVGYVSEHIKAYGSSSKKGYVSVTYFISDNNIYVNIDTSLIGFIKVLTYEDNIALDQRPDIIKMKVKNVILKDSCILHHLIAMYNIERIVGTYLDINFIIPDVSIFIALTTYKGQDTRIKSFQNRLRNRVGNVYFSIDQ